MKLMRDLITSSPLCADAGIAIDASAQMRIAAPLDFAVALVILNTPDLSDEGDADGVRMG
jgi:hypothetical protein